MKRKGTNFIQVSRNIFNDEEYADLSKDACWLYMVLNELEHRYTGDKVDFFFRSNEDLCTDCRMKLTAFKEAKKELLTKESLIQSWQMHWIDSNGKKSKKKVTAYRLL
jgi:hypothetical protein